MIRTIDANEFTGATTQSFNNGSQIPPNAVPVSWSIKFVEAFENESVPVLMSVHSMDGGILQASNIDLINYEAGSVLQFSARTE
ncbi:MAG TPA: hypothetical protein VHO25_18090, partial [Polyangiaceae bacterium]|nr:hypothetical protein [Polyangiaceae bacterium]